MAAVQRFFRCNAQDSFVGQTDGRSVSNQRIEVWWGFLRNSETSWWINLLKNQRDQGLFTNSNPNQVECLSFCFMPLIEDELSRVQTSPT